MLLQNRLGLQTPELEASELASAEERATTKSNSVGLELVDEPPEWPEIVEGQPAHPKRETRQWPHPRLAAVA